ncbi:MAG: ABC transporter ATP-binding protein [Prevotella sp.]|nr:ABC transporter ATP-binding protein [Prevotella sp.]
MIQLKDVTFRYASDQPNVFEEFNLELQAGRIYGLLGPNGSGKSTLIYLFMGLLHPLTGQVTVDGKDASRRQQSLLQELYIVPEEFELPSMTLADYVTIYSPFYPRFSRDVFNQCLQEFGLPASLHISRLSMGQKKKVLIAFALACGTRYLLMDEPTNGLDIQSKKQFRKVIAMNMTDERTIIIATHQVHDVEQLLDHVLILSNDGGTSEVLCDAMVPHLTEHFSFTCEAEPPAEALYSERTPNGYAAIAPRRPDDEETPMNLELLYAAVQSRKFIVNSGNKLTDTNK